MDTEIPRTLEGRRWNSGEAPSGPSGEVARKGRPMVTPHLWGLKQLLLVSVLSCALCLVAGAKVHFGNFFKWLEISISLSSFRKPGWLPFCSVICCCSFHWLLLQPLLLTHLFKTKSVIPTLQRRVFAQEPPDDNCPQQKQNQKMQQCLGIFAAADFFGKFLQPPNSSASHPSSFWCIWKRPRYYTFQHHVPHALCRLPYCTSVPLAAVLDSLPSLLLGYNFSLHVQGPPPNPA